ncbi:MAG TPA: amino acid ABC transporter permease [Firmicutes bacterium]|jgi:L-cystine transport system permease protein|nr:amino acid ABC transporter permease [Bacillota bacterium]
MGKLFDIQLVFEYFPKLLSRLHITLSIVFAATVLGVILGTVLALFRLAKTPILNQVAVVYISFMRGTPIIVQMFIVYYGLPLLLLMIHLDINHWDKLIFIIITYGLNMAAFMAEIIRASIIGVSIGQTEAAYSVGMSRLQAFRRIVAPQALLIALPSLGMNMMGLLQNTSIAFSLGIIDVIGKARVIGASTYHTLEGYVGAAVIFLALCILMEYGFTHIEKKLKYKMIGLI